MSSKLLSKEKWYINNELQLSNKGWRLSTDDFQEFMYLDLLTTIGYKPFSIATIYGGMNLGLLLNDDEVTADRLLAPGILIGGALHIENVEIFGHYNRAILSNELDAPFPELNIKALNSNFQLGIRYTIASRDTSNHREFLSNPFEFGLSTSNLDDFQIIYKNKIEDDQYIRFSIFNSQVHVEDLTAEMRLCVIPWSQCRTRKEDDF